YATAAAAARLLKIPADEVLVSSTGKIGVPLPMKRILQGLPRCIRALSAQGFERAAKAIMTTDAFPKIHTVQGKIGGKVFQVAGFAKGAGMIEPHMAMMLAYVMTDLDLEISLMRRAFRQAVERRFNA